MNKETFETLTTLFEGVSKYQNEIDLINKIEDDIDLIEYLNEVPEIGQPIVEAIRGLLIEENLEHVINIKEEIEETLKND